MGRVLEDRFQPHLEVAIAAASVGHPALVAVQAPASPLESDFILELLLEAGA